MIDASTYGAANWVDLSTPDIGAATRFYRDLLGWSIERHVTPVGDYYIGSAGDLEVGGMMPSGPDEPGVPAMWTVFFNVASVDDMILRVAQAGGSVLEAPFDIPEARVAVVADPSGAMLGLISGPQAAGTWLSRRHGAVCWVELLTRDPAATEGFYLRVFGWKAETQDHAGTLYTRYTLDGEDVAGAMMMPDEVPPDVPSHWSVYFAVHDCAAAERRAAELGGRVLRSTMAMNAGAFAVLADPTGATFQLMEHAAE
jgi:uncharacterized protein